METNINTGKIEVKLPFKSIGLFPKVIGGIVSVALVLMLVFFTASLILSEKQTYKNHLTKLHQLVSSISPAVTYGIWYFNAQLLDQTLEKFMHDKEVISFSILDISDKFSYVVKASGLKPLKKQPLSNEVRKALLLDLKSHQPQNSSQNDFTMEVIDRQNDTVLIKQLLIKKEGGTYHQLGIISVTFSTRHLQNRYQANRRSILLLTLTIGFLLILSLYIFFRYLIIKPLTEAARQVILVNDSTDPDLDRKTAPKDEIQYLIASFNSLLTRLAEDNLTRIKSERELISLRAVSKAMQMVAHDIRKPFSMLESILTVLSGASKAPDIESLAETFLPEVKKSVLEVNRMLNDVINIGSPNASLETTSNSVYQLINHSLNEVFQLIKSNYVQFSYGFKHSLKVQVDSSKINRVLTNVITNAYQAMSGKGRIRFETRDIIVENSKFVEIKIHNNNSFIPEAEIDFIFDAFYTKGKVDGTGLGLAICKKIVLDHLGTISCESSQTFGTQFVVTLPTTDANAIDELGPMEFLEQSSCFAIKSGLSDNGASLNEPANKSQPNPIQKLNQSSQAHLQPQFQPPLKPPTQSHSDPLKKHLSEANQPMNSNSPQMAEASVIVEKYSVLIVDDEALFRAATEEFMRCCVKPFNIHLEIQMAANYPEAMAAAKLTDFKLIILDIDLGDYANNGISILKELRKLGSKSTICIHSNNIESSEYKKSKEYGADLNIPKPMTKETFLPVLFKMINRYVIVVEDDILFHAVWKELEVVPYKMCHNPNEFWDHAKENTFLDQSLCVVVDNNFKNDPDNKGIDIGKKLRSMGYKKPVLLSSCEIFDSCPESITEIVSKNPTEIWSCIEENIYNSDKRL